MSAISSYRISKRLLPLKKIKSLDAPVANEDETTFSELLASPNNDFEELIQRIDRQRMKRELWEAVDSLEDMQAKTIHLKYQENLTIKEISKRLDVKESQVKSLESKGFRALRRPSVSKRFKPYYDEYLAAAYRRTSLTAFRNTWTSVEEWHVLQMEKQRYL